MTTGRINQVTNPESAPRRSGRRRSSSERSVLRGGRRAPSSARTRETGAGHPIAPTEFPKKQATTGTGAKWLQGTATASPRVESVQTATPPGGCHSLDGSPRSGENDSQRPAVHRPNRCPLIRPEADTSGASVPQNCRITLPREACWPEQTWPAASPKTKRASTIPNKFSRLTPRSARRSKPSSWPCQRQGGSELCRLAIRSGARRPTAKNLTKFDTFTQQAKALPIHEACNDTKVQLAPQEQGCPATNRQRFGTFTQQAGPAGPQATSAIHRRRKQPAIQGYPGEAAAKQQKTTLEAKLAPVGSSRVFLPLSIMYSRPMFWHDVRDLQLGARKIKVFGRFCMGQ